MYSTDPCSFCANAKALLARRGIAFEEINLSKDPAGRAQLVAQTGMMSFPQIVIDGQVLGGFRELLEATRNGRLDAPIIASRLRRAKDKEHSAKAPNPARGARRAQGGLRTAHGALTIRK